MTRLGQYLLRIKTFLFARSLITLREDYFNFDLSTRAEVFDNVADGRHVTAGEMTRLHPLVGRVAIERDDEIILIVNTPTIVWITPDKRLVAKRDSHYHFVGLREVVATLNSHELERLVLKLRDDRARIFQSYVRELLQLRPSAAS